ncbi:MAG: PAS domain-containing sensor histidine kinase, partial [Pseudomonadota bacterium]
MGAGRYPFIDIAVHEKVRARFAKGDALVLLSENLKTVFWANGAGARLIGCETLYECLDQGLNTSTAALRQIEAAAKAVIRHGGRTPHGFAMRAASGFLRPLVSVRMEAFTLPDDTGCLLITADNEDGLSTLQELAQNMLSGFEGTDTHAAVLGADGEVYAATPSFARLDLTDLTRGQLVGAVEHPADRLYKHAVETALGKLPSAIARIGDDPALYLMFTVEVPSQDSPAEMPDDRGETEEEPASRASEPEATEAESPEEDHRSNDETDAAASDPNPDKEDAEPADDPSAETPAVANIISNMRASKARQISAPTQDNEPPFVFDPERRPTRFVWKIDAGGSFEEISKEFADTVGPNAADVQGRRFIDVAQVFNIDPDHAIAELLRKRDTWSGKTVLWPVQGTDLQVPVDLAALPTYSRDREFDGFRGFGIVRPADATTDPERIGLALADNSNPGLRMRQGDTPPPEGEDSALLSDDSSTQPTETSP